MEAIVATAFGCVVVDLETEEAELTEHEAPIPDRVEVALPLLVATAQVGTRIVALVGRRPPLLISDDEGRTWEEAGGGLPAGAAVAIDPGSPDRMLYASESRLYVSEDGGRFWRGLEPELIGIKAVAFS